MRFEFILDIDVVDVGERLLLVLGDWEIPRCDWGDEGEEREKGGGKHLAFL